MMHLAFYAPMKPPDHPVPSGDRTIARALITALTACGARVDLASTLRTRDGTGDATAQQKLIAAAVAEVERILTTPAAARWQAWVSYHNYYKAPDLIGPAVSRALNIPYLQVESTRARKRLNGPWAAFATRAEAATDAADVVFYVSERDAQSLTDYGPPGQHLHHLRPFLATSAIPYASECSGPILSVGMMRSGDKMASYTVIAETLALLSHDQWQLRIAGDGPQRGRIETLMQGFGDQVRFLGELPPQDLAQEYQNAGLFFWPGVNEALGLVYLEAQLAGLPVLAQDRPGMREVLAPAPYPNVAEGAAGLARRLNHLLKNHNLRRSLGQSAQDHIRELHLLPAATRTLQAGLAKVGVRP